jgi:hypothetical protein
MLSKTICKECKYRHRFFELYWKNNGMVVCYKNPENIGFEVVSINELPPKHCPYALEHAVCQESVSQ